jgi:high-affinity Fe2+/Pb2+ permease
MLAVINRYKVFFIILAFIALAILVWLLLSARSDSRIPSKGVFVLEHIEQCIRQKGGSA